MLSSNGNLLKRFFVSVDGDEKRVIDSNVLVSKRLSGSENAENMISESSEDGEADGWEEDGFQSGLSASQLEGITSDSDNPQTVIKAEPPAPPQPVYDGPSPEELIAQAQEEIEAMRQKASIEIDAAKRQAVQEGLKEGKTQGYQEGLASAQEQIDQSREKLEAEYRQRIEELEPEFVRHITGIYEHIFHLNLEVHRDLVLQLLTRCMCEIEGSQDYIIHVSPEDYPFVSMSKNKLSEVLGNKSATVEIIEDMTLKKNECMVETDGGIYDCSLDSQLEALRKELLLLSYDGRAES